MLIDKANKEFPHGTANSSSSSSSSVVMFLEFWR